MGSTFSLLGGQVIRIVVIWGHKHLLRFIIRLERDLWSVITPLPLLIRTRERWRLSLTVVTEHEIAVEGLATSTELVSLCTSPLFRQPISP